MGPIAYPIPRLDTWMVFLQATLRCSTVRGRTENGGLLCHRGAGGAPWKFGDSELGNRHF